MLRNEKTVELQVNGHSRRIVVREITPLLAEKLHAVVLSGVEQGREALTAKGLADIMVGDARGKLDLLRHCSDLGEEVHELGGHAFMLLWSAFEEVNTPFLELLARTMARGLERATSLETDSRDTGSAAPAAPSSD